MRGLRLSLVFALLAIALLLVVAQTRLAQPIRVTRFARLPAGSKGWTICWADGLLCVGNDKPQYVSVAKSGSVTAVVHPQCDGLPLSAQCDKALVFSQFASSRRGHIGQYLGSISPRTGECEEIYPADKAYWLYDMFYYRGAFWSPDYRTVMAMSIPRRHEADTLVFVSRSGKQVCQWVAAQGRISSWTWSREASYPWVVTVSPGFLYRAMAKRGAELRIPSLDEAAYAMLSPSHDRVVGFASRRNQPFLVNIRSPHRRYKIKFSGLADADGSLVQWAIWSPDGKRLAMLLNTAGDDGTELYVGDPSVSLDHVVTKPFHLPHAGESIYQVGVLTAVWNSESDELFCLMTHGGRTDTRYLVGRLRLWQ